jgi:hypothetical protein
MGRQQRAQLVLERVVVGVDQLRDAAGVQPAVPLDLGGKLPRSAFCVLDLLAHSGNLATQRSWSTERMLPAGSLNQAMYGPPARITPFSSCSMPS